MSQGCLAVGKPRCSLESRTWLYATTRYRK